VSQVSKKSGTNTHQKAAVMGNIKEDSGEGQEEEKKKKKDRR